MARYTDLNDAIFDARLIGNRPALDLLQSLPADQHYVIEVGAADDRRGAELRIWRMDLDRPQTPVAGTTPDICCIAASQEEPK